MTPRMAWTTAAGGVPRLTASPMSTMIDNVRAKRQLQKQIDQHTNRYQMPVLDSAAKQLMLTEVVRTMWLGLEQIFKPPYTIYYPFEKGPLSPRFRGEHALRRYPTGRLVCACVRVCVVWMHTPHSLIRPRPSTNSYSTHSHTHARTHRRGAVHCLQVV